MIIYGFLGMSYKQEFIGIIIIWFIFVVCFAIFGVIKANNITNKELSTIDLFEKKLEENINKEINLFFQEKNLNYEFKDKQLEIELKERLKASIIDQRSNGYRYNNSYINRTTTKDKEIYSIINKYYNLDKKGKVYNVDLEEENIKEIEYKEIN